MIHGVCIATPKVAPSDVHRAKQYIFAILIVKNYHGQYIKNIVKEIYFVCAFYAVQ
jgi:hypothetical protein